VGVEKWGFSSKFQKNMRPQGRLNREGRGISQFDAEKAILIVRGNVLHHEPIISQK